MAAERQLATPLLYLHDGNLTEAERKKKVRKLKDFLLPCQCLMVPHGHLMVIS